VLAASPAFYLSLIGCVYLCVRSVLFACVCGSSKWWLFGFRRCEAAALQLCVTMHRLQNTAQSHPLTRPIRTRPKPNRPQADRQDDQQREQQGGADARVAARGVAAGACSLGGRGAAACGCSLGSPGWSVEICVWGGLNQVGEQGEQGTRRICIHAQPTHHAATPAARARDRTGGGRRGGLTGQGVHPGPQAALEAARGGGGGCGCGG